MPGKRISFDVVQLVFYYHAIGKSNSEISRKFNLSRQTVYNNLKRAETEERLEAKPASGRPRKISERVERNIVKKVEQIPMVSLRNIASELKEETGVVFSHEGIRKILNRNKYISRIARKKMLSVVNVEKRLLFAQSHV